MDNSSSRNILIIAAEDSSCAYADRFLELWKKEKNSMGNVHFWGIGNLSMQQKGFETVSQPKEMAVMGFFEVLKHYHRIKRILFNIVDLAKERKPDLVILIDYAEFNLRLAKELRFLVKKIVYWIPPQMWAWRQSRIKKIKKYVDEVIVVFPFEKEFFKSHQINAHYFGHPLTDFIEDRYLDPQFIYQERVRNGIDPQLQVIGLLPGSRYSEIDRHLNILLKSADLIYKKYPHTIFLIPVAPSIEVEDIRSRLNEYSFPLIIQKKRKPEESLCLLDFAIAVSGTVTLLLALLKKPMIIIYKFSLITYWITQLIPFKIKFFGLPNIIANQLIMPEFFQNEATEEKIFSQTSKYLNEKKLLNDMVTQLTPITKELKPSSHSVISRVVDFCFHLIDNPA